MLLHATLLLAGLIPPSDTTKFYFGGENVRGCKQVTANAIYSDSIGFGFEESKVVDVRPKGRSLITGESPYFFSVKLPEGNYDVTVGLVAGSDPKSVAIRAENRRNMTGKIDLAPANLTQVSFTVHVRDTFIRNSNGEVTDRVRIKPRERNYAQWDNRLTIEFAGDSPSVRTLAVTPNTKATTVFLAGNSTVVDQDKEPWASWGQMIPAFFQPGKVAIANYAESGESLSSWIRAKRFEKVLRLMKPGDYLLVEFGHNDQKQKGEGIGAFTSYSKDLRYVIDEVRKKKGIPVLVTSVQRRSFDSTGHIQHTLGDYPAAVRAVAKEKGTAVIDLNKVTKVMYEAWGEEKSIRAFVHYPANTFPGQTAELKDNTHFNNFGAWEVAKCVVKEIQDNNIPLVKLLRKNLPAFDPAHPDSPEMLYWPASRLRASAKPDGN
ncbi:rhamnogalacturonan acetylesterase [Chitinophaga sp. sic0106]|uniref:rhamnogalacturonan acetylesterase n=1 Tax=Chitinophaga sp. sic0106 TaxID=2854785 RepID=UPI001C44AE00|nr:rhamnogalacturonan acetylesterase [Chitinophaga sp. sic0106]MBV7529191.1 rhamnogalacturonan acetylesterase [Chitinophaga sp. sic0106]